TEGQIQTARKDQADGPMIYHLLVFLFGAERHYGYEHPLFRGLLACLVAFAMIWRIGPRVIRELVRKKIGDVPDFDRVDYNLMTKHKANVPTMGGIMILLSIAVSVLLWADLRNYYIYLACICMLWLGAVGMWDDWLKLTAKSRGETRDGLKTYQKLLFQLGLGVVLAVFIYRHGQIEMDKGETSYFNVLNLPFIKFERSELIRLGRPTFILIAVLVITGTSNAVNLTDGLDGLAAGCAMFACLVFMVLAYIAGNSNWASYFLMPPVPGAGELAVVCGAMTGACLGFLWYNCHPAQVFMGDTGSLPLGGLIG